MMEEKREETGKGQHSLQGLEDNSRSLPCGACGEQGARETGGQQRKRKYVFKEMYLISEAVCKE